MILSELLPNAGEQTILDSVAKTQLWAEQQCETIDANTDLNGLAVLDAAEIKTIIRNSAIAERMFWLYILDHLDVLIAKDTTP